MNDSINFLNALSSTIYNGLKAVTFPVLGVSFLVVLLTVLFINASLWVIRSITGGRQDSDLKGHNGLDNNNNYIYRR